VKILLIAHPAANVINIFYQKIIRQSEKVDAVENFRNAPTFSFWQKIKKNSRVIIK